MYQASISSFQLSPARASMAQWVLPSSFRHHNGLELTWTFLSSVPSGRVSFPVPCFTWSLFTIFLPQLFVRCTLDHPGALTFTARFEYPRIRPFLALAPSAMMHISFSPSRPRSRPCLYNPYNTNHRLNLPFKKRGTISVASMWR